ncbi:redoxin domain-containing protein [Tautonia plasticadhaerens]|uniref:Thiol-disulfide oxidoreductase ResA n=1 Tax=Tautonia plasticadhaerens TaxID=2527974 RepID=A0A518H7C6_9BACT|nr:redoxin domain-containing protein [Tautonia plasticadhaerens]QDV36742.1 Thiol-disulfide oxidoreductase ResA [Tautonia plasticadhaerens]
MQTRAIGWIITAVLLLSGLTGCRGLPRGGGLGLGRREGPEVRTIAGIGSRPERPAVGGRPPSTISSRVEPPPGGDRPGQIVGKVVDDLGIPVANARVRLAVDGAPAGREVEGTTNRSGEFLLKGLRPGERYTVIAEWDDGREVLLGRSSVSAPADELRIRVASTGLGDRAEATSGTRDDSSGVALFSREGGGLEPVPPQDDPPQAPARAVPMDQDSPDQSRSGWVPSDSVRRASLDTERDAPLPSSPRRSPPRPRPEDDELALDFPASTLGASSSVDPSERGVTSGRFDPSPEIPESSPSERSVPTDPTIRTFGPEPARPSPTPGSTVRYRGQDATLPTVQHFEPESAGDRDEPDPPLLMTDVPPEVESRAEPTAPADPEGRWSTPGSLQLAPASAPPDVHQLVEGPTVAELPDLSVPNPPDPPVASLPGQPDSGTSSPDSDGDPVEIEPVPVSEPEMISKLSIAPLPVLEPEATDAPISGSELPEAAAEAPTPADSRGSFRWSDLPPPDRLVGTDPDGDRMTDDPGEAGGWASGLMRLVGRGRADSADAPVVEPAVSYDAEQARLDDFTLPDLQGRTFRLRDADSEFTLLCFWGTWCDPCLAAMPHLDELQRQFGPDRLRVVSIAYERQGEGGPRAVARTSRRLGLNFPILLAPGDGSCPVAGAMEVRYYPTLILLDREGRVVHRETGATGEKLMRLDRAIASAMDTSIMTITRR